MKNIVIVFAICFVYNLQAQESLVFRANYSVGVPLSQKSYLNNASYRGFGLGFGKIFETNFSIGMEVTWNHYYQYEARQTYFFEGGAITTDLYKYRQYIPLTLTMNYFFFRPSRVKLYTGLGIGTSFVLDKIFFNAYSAEAKNFGFLLQPKVGTTFAIDENERFHLFAECAYNYSTNKSTDLDYNSLSNLQLGIGLYFLINE